MMTRQTRISIIVLILLALLLLLIWLLYFLFSKPSESSVVEESTTTVTQEDPIPTRPTISDQELETERETRTVSADVVSLSKTFVARYGSYSNEADFANLVDVLPLMSNAFAAKTEAFIKTAEAPDQYYAVTTNVVTVKVEEQDDAKGTARVALTTQREEAQDSLQNVTVKYQDIVLTFVKEDDSWKVDSATWQ